MSDFDPTNPHETLPGRPVSSATSDPSAAGSVVRQRRPAAFAASLFAILVGLGADGHAGSPAPGYGDGWRTGDVDGPSWRRR
jgi:hypothetical protein